MFSGNLKLLLNPSICQRILLCVSNGNYFFLIVNRPNKRTKILKFFWMFFQGRRPLETSSSELYGTVQHCESMTGALGDLRLILSATRYITNA